jgi:hypothetical protein
MQSIIANLLAVPCQQKRIKRYRHFISTDNEDIDKVFEKKKWPPILGSERFVDMIKEKFFYLFPQVSLFDLLVFEQGRRFIG